MTSIRLLLVSLIFISVTTYSQSVSSNTYKENAIAITLDDLVLNGTLTIPGNAKYPVPLVLIIPGSGSTDRNGNNFSAGLHCNSYKQLAYALSENNIASFRYDKRGVGESKPSNTTNTKRNDFSKDVEDVTYIINNLKKDKRFSKLIIIGHSQGSLVGMLAAKLADKFISIAGLGYPGNETLKRQLSKQPAYVSEKANPIIDSLRLGYSVKHIPELLAPLFSESMQPYLISWFKYDPAKVLSELNIQSLIIQGDNDIQIPVTEAQRLISLSSNSQLIIIEKMNHVFKIVEGTTQDNLKTYSNPDLPISSKMVAEIVTFIIR